MDIQSRLTRLNELLSVIYGRKTDLNILLAGLGFEPAQVEALLGRQPEAVLEQFLEVIHKRLTSESGKDTYYQILSRRHGLDGEPPETLEQIAQKQGTSPEYLRRLFEEILQRCQSKTSRAELEKSLRTIAIALIGKSGERPSREQVAAKLQRLTNLRAAADVARLDYEARRAEILKKVQSELDALEIEYQPLFESTAQNLSALENEIKTEVLLHGASVTASALRAVYMQGRVSWDNDGMNRYAAAHPDVLQFRKQGEPTVTLRSAADKG